MRKGFFAGFLVAAALASIFAETDVVEAPNETRENPPEPETEDSPRGLLDKVRRHIREVIEAAREAKRAKEEEMLREFDQARHPRFRMPPAGFEWRRGWDSNPRAP